MTDLERVKKAIDWLTFAGYISNQRDLANLLGYSESSLSQILTSKVNLSPRFIKKLANIDRRLSEKWIITGEGEMLKSDNKSKEISGHWVPLVPISVMAGELSGFDIQGVDKRNCEMMLSPIPGVDMALPVYGDSMEPEYPNGSKVLVKRINHEEFIVPGNVYVIDTTNGPLLKKVRNAENPDFIRCISINEKAGYDPFDVPKSSVRAMYRVIMCIAIKG